MANLQFFPFVINYFTPLSLIDYQNLKKNNLTIDLALKQFCLQMQAYNTSQ